MSEKELKKWLHKLQLYWVLHGGVEKWGHREINPCSAHCHMEEECGGFDKQLMVNPVLTEMYYEKRHHRKGRWCAEWIKYV